MSTSATQHRQRLAVDVGGTFTDLVLMDDTTGMIKIEKEPSQIGELADHLFAALERLDASPASLGMILHGSTVAINTIVQEKGARIGLITTEGFRDVLELGRGNRPEVYNLLYKPPVPLIPRYLRKEVSERMTPSGEIVVELDEDAVRAATRELIAEDVKGIAICFLHSYANTGHEQRAREIVHDEAPGVEVSTSGEITREWREFERTSTVALNTYIMPRMQAYVGRLERALEDRGFEGALNIVLSTGGALPAKESRHVPIRTLESGPAGGVIGAAALGAAINEHDIIAADVGGTTFDVGLVLGGAPLEKSQTVVNRRPVLVPTIDVESVGAGGGSIAWIDDSGAFRVGPQSAEADPGPVCFGRGGTEPTVTDAHVVLGRINPENFLGSRMQLEVEAAREAIRERIARPLDLDLEHAAHGIAHIADTNMIHAIRRVTIERGHDPREMALLCYGGGGGLFAGPIARDLGIRRAIIPPDPAVFSAWGILHSDYREDAVLTRVTPTESLSTEQLVEQLRTLESECRDRLASTGIDASAAGVEWIVDMRYDGQEHTVRVPIPSLNDLAQGGKSTLGERFEILHEQTYGHSTPGHSTELVNFRATATSSVSKPRLAEIAAQADATRPSGSRPVYFDGHGWVETKTYERSGLGAGASAAGPAIVEEWSSTTIVLPDQQFEVDRLGNLILSATSKESQ